MERSRRELYIDMVIYIGIFESKQVSLFPCFSFKTGVSYCEGLVILGFWLTDGFWSN